MKIPSFPQISRRQFIQLSSCAAISSTLNGQNILNANNRVRWALIGCGNRGKQLTKQFVRVADAQIVAICDPDSGRMDAFAHELASPKPKKKKEGEPEKLPEPIIVEKIQDYRKIYERPDIDAVVIASPNYWHTVHAIEAMQAGKHVYVEKPVTFSPWEARQLETAEKKYGKIVAAGYQNRSDTGPQAGIKYVQEGNLGKIERVRSVCMRNRNSIGKINSALTPPNNIDFDLWLGPAQEHPILRPKLHYDWHWDFHTGNGDIGNQGVHEIDMVCWLLGDPALPTQVQAFGNRFGWNDAGDTPNMISAWFEMAGTEVIIETNDMMLAPDRNVSGHREGTRVGIIAECEGGTLKGGRGGMIVVEKGGREILKRFRGDSGWSHCKNFIKAVQKNDPSGLNSRISTAINSGSIAQLCNISYQLGELTSGKELTKTLPTPGLTEIVADQAKQLSAWGIPNPQYLAGPSISVDPATHLGTSPGVDADMNGPNYREGFGFKPLV